MGLDKRFTWEKCDLDRVDFEGEIPPEKEAWIKLVKDKKLKMPQLFLIDQDGRLVSKQVLPKTVDEVITLVREYLPDES